jgi:glycosyltransferase involved in cell wall biosynthesis
LPYLWRDGALGGRRFRVLMTRLPMGVLQARLDAAFAAHPDRPTLADYRADPALAEAEAEALAAADAVATPHAEIAALFGDRATRLDWLRPPSPASAPRPGRVFAFPGPTVGRKGAFEVREAARRLGATVRPLGAELEGPGFWSGLAVDALADPVSWLDGVRAVVLPALAEAAPRRLLAALAAGVPVIATAACGLDPQAGLTLVPMDDVEALAAAMATAGAF